MGKKHLWGERKHCIRWIQPQEGPMWRSCVAINNAIKLCDEQSVVTAINLVGNSAFNALTVVTARETTIRSSANALGVDKRIEAKKKSLQYQEC